MNDSRITPDTLTIPEVAQRLGIGRSLAYDLARREQIPGVIRLGHRLLVKRGAFDRWIGADVTNSSGGAGS